MASYWIVQHESGEGWAVRREGTERITSTHATQREAIDAAHPLIRNSGGGELIVQDRHGQIRQKDTIATHDPYPPAG